MCLINHRYIKKEEEVRTGEILETINWRGNRLFNREQSYNSNRGYG